MNMNYILDIVVFQAEDGIRDAPVTGVQTCALPISAGHAAAAVEAKEHRAPGAHHGGHADQRLEELRGSEPAGDEHGHRPLADIAEADGQPPRRAHGAEGVRAADATPADRARIPPS